MWILILPLFHTSLFLKYENSRLKCTMATSTLKPENLRPRCTKVTFKRPACQSILASPTCVQATPSTPIPCRVLGEPPPPHSKNWLEAVHSCATNHVNGGGGVTEPLNVQLIAFGHPPNNLVAFDLHASPAGHAPWRYHPHGPLAVKGGTS